MSASSSASTATKRLLHELKDYARDPDAGLLQLGPVADDQILHWTAVMRGPDEGKSGYEGRLCLQAGRR